MPQKALITFSVLSLLVVASAALELHLPSLAAFLADCWHSEPVRLLDPHERLQKRFESGTPLGRKRQPRRYGAGMAHTKRKHEILDHQQFFEIEGFRPNGYQIRGQRDFLDGLACCKIDCDGILLLSLIHI